MFKKVLIFGIAFGSACAALMIMYYLNSLYLQNGFKAFITPLGQAILVVLAILLCLRSIKREFADKVTLGHVLLSGLFITVITAGVTVIGYSWLLSNYPGSVEAYKQYLVSSRGIKGDIKELTSVGTVAKIQFGMYMSIGMVVSCIIGLRSINSMKKS